MGTSPTPTRRGDFYGRPTEILDVIKKKFAGKITSIDIPASRRIYIEIPSDYIKKAVDFLFNQLKMRFSTATAIDEKDRFELLYHFSYDAKGVFISLRVNLDFNSPVIDTITDIILGAGWIEREMHELLGIDFKGNNNLKNLLLSDDYKGKEYPLRK